LGGVSIRYRLPRPEQGPLPSSPPCFDARKGHRDGAAPPRLPACGGGSRYDVTRCCVPSLAIEERLPPPHGTRAWNAPNRERDSDRASEILPWLVGRGYSRGRGGGLTFR